MANTDDKDQRQGEVAAPADLAPDVYNYTPASFSSLLRTAFVHNVRFRLAKRMLDERTAAIRAHTGMLDAEAANANARFALVQAWERFDKDLEPTLENDRRIAEARRCQELTDALLAAMKSADALERFRATKEKAAHTASAKAKPKSYSEQFRTRSANRAEIYAARDGAIREILERAKAAGRDESDPDVQAEIEEVRQYAAELISKLDDDAE